MTDNDKALVERLRADWPEILVEKHWMMDSDAIEEQRKEAADRIEAQAAEIERLRAALWQIARLRTDLSGDFSLGSYQSDIARAALGDEK